MCIRDSFQPLSTTSYEEAPRYSTEKTYDSFRDADPYGLPTSQRLLVMGREDSSPIPDGGYMLWGDDNGSTTTEETEGKTPWHVMSRRWLVRTNIDSTEYRRDVWTRNGITVTSDGFMDAVSQNEPKAVSYTHLDVYKRQIIRSIKHILSFTLDILNRRLITVKVNDFKVDYGILTI